MAKNDFQEMFDHVVHIGHRTQKWDPRMKKFIYGETNGIHIIDLEKTKAYLDEALAFLSKISSEGRNILFVSTKPQSVRVLKNAAEECSMPYVVAKWIPGLLTNFSTVKTRIKYLVDLKQQSESGELEKYTKKEASKMKKEMEKLQVSLGGVENMKDLPDVVFVLDVVRDAIVVKEAKTLGIPVVALVDTNGNPGFVDYPIPGNDDSLKAITFFIGKIVDAVKKSRKAKK